MNPTLYEATAGNELPIVKSASESSGGRAFASSSSPEEAHKMNLLLSNNENPRPRPIPFAFLAPAARQVCVAGEFNDWNPTAMPMHKSPNGMWSLNVTLKPGRHQYRFVADGVWQDDPAAQQRVANTLGGENCLKIVG